MQISAALNEFFDNQEAFLDQFIDSGSDQELFVASYIHGHFSVIAANTLQQIAHFSSAQEAADYFVIQLNRSITEAIGNGELSDQDAEDVTTMLAKITY